MAVPRTYSCSGLWLSGWWVVPSAQHVWRQLTPLSLFWTFLTRFRNSAHSLAASCGDHAGCACCSPLWPSTTFTEFHRAGNPTDVGSFSHSSTPLRRYSQHVNHSAFGPPIGVSTHHPAAIQCQPAPEGDAVSAIQLHIRRQGDPARGGPVRHCPSEAIGRAFQRAWHAPHL